MNIYFVYPGRSTASGGHKQIRLMASILNELGIPTSLLLDGSTADSHLYDVAVPVARFDIDHADRYLSDRDLVFFPEGRVANYLRSSRSWKCRKAVINQNGFYTLQNRLPRDYSSNEIEIVIAIAPYVAMVSHFFLSIDSSRIFHVPPWVIRPPFDIIASGSRSRELAICYMPRKLPDHVSQVKDLVQRAEPRVPWVEIDGVPETTVSQRFSNNAIFFSTQDHEGCPLPALEAMCRGCVVAGYAGTRFLPHPYATADNGFWAPDRSIREAAAQVLRAIRFVRAGGTALERLLSAGRATAERFTKAEVVRALQPVVRAVTTRSYYSEKPAIPDFDWQTRLRIRRLILEHRCRDWRQGVRAWIGRQRDRFCSRIPHLQEDNS